MYILADDFGWADADWHRPPGWDEAATPNMMKELKAGIELDNMYSFKFCAPTRSSIQSGRNPIHVNLVNVDTTVYNRNDPVAGFQGIARNFTTVAQKMKEGGYATHMAGKWDGGCRCDFSSLFVASISL